MVLTSQSVCASSDALAHCFRRLTGYHGGYGHGISTSVPDQRSAALPELLHLHPLGYSGNLDNSLSGHWLLRS